MSKNVQSSQQKALTTLPQTSAKDWVVLLQPRAAKAWIPLGACLLPSAPHICPELLVGQLRKPQDTK
jgi:hypothetical protein